MAVTVECTSNESIAKEI